MSHNPYSNLSHEELLKLLAERDAQLAATEAEVEKIREDNQRLQELREQQKALFQEEAKRLQAHKHLLEVENSQMKAKLIRMQVAVKEAGPVLKSFFEDLKVRNAFDPHDPDFEETFNRILQGYFNGFRAVATLVTHFRAGNESQKISKSGLEELNQLFRKFDTEFSQFRSRKEKWIATLNLLHHAVKEVLETKETKDSMPGLIGDALEAVAAPAFEEQEAAQTDAAPQAEPDSKAAAAAPSSLEDSFEKTMAEPEPNQSAPEAPKKFKPAGRQRNKSTLPVTVIEDDRSLCVWIPKFAELLGKRTIEVHEMMALLNDMLGRFQQDISLWVDEHGKVFSNLHADSCVGVTPRSSVGMRLIVNMAWALYNSLSLTRAERMFAGAACFGNETLLKNLQHFSDYVLDPLFERMCGVLGNSAYVGCDETTWNVLEVQGRGVCKAVENPKSTNWVLSMCNFGAEIPVSLFLRLDSRSAESMNKAINGAFGEDGFNPEYLVVDGYPGYPALVRKREGNWSRSLCLSHLRRYLCEALGFSSWEKAQNSKTLAEMKDSFVKRLEQSDSRMCLLVSLEVIRRIFELESETKRHSKKNGLSDAEHLKELARVRNEHTRTLMEHLDRMVWYLQPEYAKRNGKQTDLPVDARDWVNAKDKHPIGAFVVYYLNNRADFWTFLEDPNIPLSTNAVERQIRTVALARNGSPHMQSAKGMDVICKIFSVFETAKRCGVADPLAWLDRFAHYQYAHWIETRAQHDLDTGAGKDFNKAYADWNLAELSYGPHVDPFLPWNCSNGVPEWRKLKAPDTESET